MAKVETSKPKASQLRPTMEALGIILAFICRSAPYAEFRAAKIIKAVQHQLSSGCHVCIIEEDRLVAYAGWLPINARDGEKWLEGNVTLKPAPSSNTDAAALTIVSVTSTSQIPQLIRGCRRLAPQRTIFFKRDYLGGRSKKSKVYNRA